MFYSFYGMKNTPLILIGFLRALMRIILLFILLLPVCMLAVLFLFSKKSLKRMKLRKAFQKVISSIMLFIIGSKLYLKGPIPDYPSVIVSNHLGVLEIIAYAKILQCHIIAKESLKKIPIIGFLLTKLGGIFINRKSLSSMIDVSNEMERAMQLGERILIFPEGTTSHGEGVREPYTALLKPVIEKQYPLVIASVSFKVRSNHWPLASESVCWADGQSLLFHLFKLLHLPGVDITLEFIEKAIYIQNRKKAAGIIHKEMLKIFHPMKQYSSEERAQWAIPINEDDESWELKQKPVISK